MPSDAQKEAGNYAKERVRLFGLPITIENRKGTVRSGTDKQGRPWAVRLPYSYGFIRRTLGHDGDQVDVFIGPKHTSDFVLVVNQHDRHTGVFEEIKIGLGYANLAEAKAAYRAGYQGANVPRATFRPTTLQRLKEWLRLRQSWTTFDLSARLGRLTDLESGMKRVVQKVESDKPSLARKVAGAVGAGAAVAGFYKYTSTRPAARKHRYRMARAKIAADPVRAARLAVTAGRATPFTGPMQGPKMPPPAVKVSVKPVAAKVAEAAVRGGSLLKSKVLVQDVTKPRVKKVVERIRAGVRRMSARQLLIQFQQERYSDGTMGVSLNPLSAYRKASRVVPWVNRAGQAAGDLGDMAAGRKVKDPFYKKPWFKRAATTVAIGAPLLAAGLVQSGERKQLLGDRPRTGKTVADRVDRLTHRAANTKRRVYSKIGLSARIKNPILLQAVLTHIENFDYTADERGWDLRDARGKSARIYAPGTKRRERRGKEWDERTDNIRLIRNVAGAAAVAGTVGTVLYRNKAKAATTAANVAERSGREQARKRMAGIIRARAGRHPFTRGTFAPSLPLVTRLKNASARVATVDFARKSSNPLGSVIDATRKNIVLPDRPEIPGEGAVKFVYGLPPKRRAGVLRILGAGTVAGAGLVGGTWTKRPKTGAAIGGLGAGLLLG